jgi:hypothetical protein
MKALGRYAYEFSRMIHHMRWQLPRITLRAVPDAGLGPNTFAVLRLYTGDMAATQLADTFFAVTEVVADYNADEAKMAAWLRNRLTPWINLRNDFFHGEWQMGWVRSTSWTLGGDSPGPGGEVSAIPPTIFRTKAGRSGEKSRATEYTVAELDAKTDDFVGLRRKITEWGHIVGNPSYSRSAIKTALESAPREQLAEGSEQIRMDGFQIVRPSDVYVMRDGVVTREGPLAGEVGMYDFA